MWSVRTTFVCEIGRITSSNMCTRSLSTRDLIIYPGGSSPTMSPSPLSPSSPPGGYGSPVMSPSPPGGHYGSPAPVACTPHPDLIPTARPSPRDRAVSRVLVLVVPRRALHVARHASPIARSPLPRAFRRGALWHRTERIEDQSLRNMCALLAIRGSSSA